LRGLCGADFCADHFAGDDYFYAAVLLAAFGGTVVGCGHGLAEALRGDGAGVEALVDQILTDGLGALLGKSLIERVAADVVGVAFDGEI